MRLPATKRRLPLFILLSVLAICLCLLAGRPMLRFVADPVRVHAWVDANGLLARLGFLGMMVFQVVLAVIPGEPLEVAVGYSFGVWEGTAICLLGAFLGTTLVFLFVRRFGRRAVQFFFPEEKLRSLRILNDPARVYPLSFLLFFIPGTPKDLLTWFLGLTDARLWPIVAISTFARIPSVVTSTLAGSALGQKNLLAALVVFAATGLISLLGLFLYRRITAHSAATNIE